MTQLVLTSVWTTRLTLTVSKTRSGTKNGAQCAPFFLPFTSSPYATSRFSLLLDRRFRSMVINLLPGIHQHWHT
ncbi:hypothetical protein EH228_16025 [Erwinia endophytica]|nr:hypothetical protein EH228_16025 [Erwinia endophytica]